MSDTSVKRSIYQARETELEKELELASLAHKRAVDKLAAARGEEHRSHGRVQHLQGQLHALRDLARRDGAAIE